MKSSDDDNSNGASRWLKSIIDEIIAKLEQADFLELLFKTDPGKAWLNNDNIRNEIHLFLIEQSPIDIGAEDLLDSIHTMITDHQIWLLSKEKEGKQLNLIGYSLDHFNFSKQNLSQAKISDARLSQCDFSNATLIGTDFSNSIMVDANLVETKLNNANLRNAYLRRANLSKSDLRHADMLNAILSGANFENADTNQTNFHKADLANAKISKAQIKKSINTPTTLPTTFLIDSV